MRLPQLKGWQNILALILVPLLLGLKSAYDAHNLNSWAMVIAAIEAAFFAGIVPMVIGWLGMESPAAPHIYDGAPEVDLPATLHVHDAGADGAGRAVPVASAIQPEPPATKI